MADANKIKILYMEDDPGLGQLFQKRLSRSGYEVGLARNGREGLDMYEESAFDLLIVDYRMPEMDGLQVLQKLTENGTCPPVIMLTGAGNEEIAVEAMKMGAIDYITKDINGNYFELLPLVIEEAVKRYHLAQERVRMQKELKRYATELERSNKELQQFAYIVSHDLKEPLHTIRGFAEFLKESCHEKFDPQAGEFLHYIVDGTMRMERLITGLLDYSRVKSKEARFKPVDCNHLVSLVINDLNGTIEARQANVTIDTLPSVMGDGRLLRRLFQNLIDNAIKYCREDHPEVEIRAQKADEFWQFSVKDNGIGIAPKHQDKIFMIFQRLHTRKEFEGDGLGLAICKKIVENHKGDIWVESSPGKGSTFYFTIFSETE